MEHRAHHLRRRAFLRSVGAVAGLGLAPRFLWGDEPPAALSAADVGIARGSSMTDAVRAAVRLAGGLDFIREGQTVLIKPNVCGAVKHPATTHPEVLYAVIRMVAERGPKRIIVADRPFSPRFETGSPKTLDVMQRIGHIDAVQQAISDCRAPAVAVGLEDAGAEFEQLGLAADTEHWRRITPKAATHWPNGFELAELLYRVDHVINLPVIKTHFQAWFTMSMKSFVGMSHHRTRKEFHDTWKGEGSLFDQKRTASRRRGIKRDPVEEAREIAPFVNRIAELNLGITPALNILDGTQSFVFGGPSSGDTADGKVIIASRDRIAADATGVAVLKWLGTEERLQNRSVWENPFIRHAIQIGLGIDRVEKLRLKQDGLDGEIEQIRKMLV